MNRNGLRTIILLLVVLVYFNESVAFAQETAENSPAKQGETTTEETPKSLMEKASFLAGYQFMRNAKQQGIEFDMEQLIAGMKKASEGQPLGMDIEEINAVNMAFQQQMMKQRQAKFDELAAKNKAEGEAFLAKYAAEKGVSKSPSGLFYKVITPGTGKKPQESDVVKIQFKGTSLNGDVLISTEGKPPATLTVASQIPGFTNIIQQMKTGAKWEVAIPPEQGFGKNGSRFNGPNETVVYEIELLEIVDKEAASKKSGDAEASDKKN